MLVTIDEVRARLANGKTLVLAGNEELLRAVPKGNWIGGTIPYFMTSEGGKTSRDRLFVEEIPPLACGRKVVVYDEANIANIGVDAPDRGYTIVILPAFSAIHQRYALEAPRYKDLFLKTVAGWISGVHLDELNTRKPKVVNGMTGEVIDDRGVALHIELPPSHRAQIGIVNIFEPGDGDEIVFPVSGFQTKECMVNGTPRDFADYLAEEGINARLPLVTNYCGALINVSIRAINARPSTVTFYAPVFEGVTYHLARPVESYAQRFATAIPAGVLDPVFSCNCVLNYVYGALENQRTGRLVGPMTFGEIAFQLLNQTLVHVTVVPME